MIWWFNSQIQIESKNQSACAPLLTEHFCATSIPGVDVRHSYYLSYLQNWGYGIVCLVEVELISIWNAVVNSSGRYSTCWKVFGGFIRCFVPLFAFPRSFVTGLRWSRLAQLRLLRRGHPFMTSALEGGGRVSWKVDGEVTELVREVAWKSG